MLIQNVTIWNPDHIRQEFDVLIKGNTIRKIGKNLAKEGDYIDGSGKVLLPAGIDPQVHLRVPGQAEKETAASGLLAAESGGITALLTMPNTKPVIDDLESLMLARSEIKKANSRVKVLFAPAITKGQNGKECIDFKSLAAEKDVAAFTDDGVGVVSDALMEEAFKASSEFDLPILQHAEFPSHPGVIAEGPVQEKLATAAYPASAEYEMVKRDIKLLEKYPSARYHVLHVSAQKTLEYVERAKEKGLKVTCEVSPHHLFFSSSDINEANTAFKMNPPLRSCDDREALQKGLASGLIDFVATDHAPHELEAKGSTLLNAAYGTTGLETSLRVLLTLVKQGKLEPSRLVQVFSTIPASFLKLPEGEYGDIREGMPLRAVLVDVDKNILITDDILKSKSKNNCFVGHNLYGDISRVWV